MMKEVAIEMAELLNEITTVDTERMRSSGHQVISDLAHWQKKAK